MLSFCTLFNTNYLSRGLALYQSLQSVCPSFHLYVFAFDDDCYTYLENNPRPHLTVISLAEFEYAALLKVKPTRSMAEYCWTSTPFTILYCLEKFQLPHCTYLDADLVFYSNPQVLLDEMGDKAVLISKHRYPKIYDQSWYSGIYCVQFMCFKNTTAGLHVLNWWKDRCIEWCYGRLEDGKFGDQKYLDDWPTRFDSVHVMQHQGGGVAPWNLLLYNFYEEQALKMVEKNTRSTYDVIFFHFHGLQFFTDNKVSLAGPLYEISKPVKKLFYFPYIHLLQEITTGIQQRQPGLNANGALKSAPPVYKLFIEFSRGLLGVFSRHFPSAFHLKNYNFKNHNHVHSLQLKVET